MPPAKEHDHKQEKKHQHNVEEKHDHAKHAHQEEAHKHEDHAHKEETHKHSENCKHNHSHADEGIFSHFEMTPEYKQSLIKCLLGASLLLNVIFILATFFGKRKDDTK